MTTPTWLKPALEYVPEWLAFQMRQTEQPGCAIAVAHRGRLVLEKAFGHANAGRRTPLTTRHRFRVASHSKTFTAAGILRLREQGKLRLDDPAGRYVAGLDRRTAEVTIAQLLSHSAGIVRDGYDSGQWDDRRPFLDREELLHDLRRGPILPAAERFKYSNHGFGLVGLILESVTGEPFCEWIQRDVVERAGLGSTYPDLPIPRGTPMASGHGTKLVLGHRFVIPGENPTRALAAATGFVSTAGDLARFFAQLLPSAKGSFLSAASRREMVRRHWTAEHSSVERHYGLGTISGTIEDWPWFGHSGGFQGFITRTVVLPRQEITVSVLTNAVDGMAHAWLEGTVHVLRAFAERGAPSRRLAGWSGRWWGLWGVHDYVPAGNRVLVASPGMTNPVADAAEIEVESRDRGRIVLDTGFSSHGEEVLRVRSRTGRVTEVWHAGTKMVPERRLAAELSKRYRKR